MECLLKSRAFVVKKVAANCDDPSLKAGQVTWSRASLEELFQPGLKQSVAQASDRQEVRVMSWGEHV